MSNLRLASLAGALVSLAALPAQALPREDPTLEQRLAKLAGELETQRASAHVAGMAIAIVKDDEVILARGFGLADRENETPVTPQTLFAIGSSTKAFTATLIGMLVDEGAMDWDAPVTRYLPYFELALETEREDAEALLRDLLCHRTGFTRMSMLWAGGRVSRGTILRTAVQAEPWAGFREEFHYNNVMFLAAGEASAAVAETTWDALLAERIFRPLGMDDSNTSVSQSRKDPRLAQGYMWDEDNGVYDHERMLELDAIGPAGSINSNVLDMAQWVRFQLAGGELAGQRLISEQRLHDTWEAQIEIGDGVSYGLGWFCRDWNGQPLIEHGGNIDGFGAQVAFLPESQVGYVLLTNATFTALQTGSMEIVFDALLGEWDEAPATSEAGGQNHDEYVGTYIANFGQFEDVEFPVLIQNDRLAVDVPGQMVFELKEPDEEGKWGFAMTDQIAVSFDRDEDGSVIAMRLYQAGMAFDLPREGVTIEPEVPLDELARYLGEYQSAESEKKMRVLVQNNRLAVDVPGQMVFELDPPDDEGNWLLRVRSDLFVSFGDDGDGRIQAMTFNEGSTSRELMRVEAEGDAADEALPTVEELLELRETEERVAALEALGNFKVSGKLRLAQAGVEGTITTWCGGTDRFRNVTDFGVFGSAEVAVRRDEGWSYNSFQGLDSLDGDALEQARIGHPAAALGDWRAFYDSIRVLRREELDGRPVFVLKLSRGDAPPTTFSVDAETGDVLESVTMLVEGPVRLPVTARFSNFDVRHGLRMPLHVVAENDANGRSIIDYETLEAGLTLADDFFVLTESEADQGD